MHTMDKIGLMILIPTLVGAAMILAMMFANRQNGIYPIGTQAVYLQGEACTVNMTYERTEQEIWDDFVQCMALHREHKK